MPTIVLSIALILCVIAIFLLINQLNKAKSDTQKAGETAAAVKAENAMLQSKIENEHQSNQQMLDYLNTALTDREAQLAEAKTSEGKAREEAATLRERIATLEQNRAKLEEESERRFKIMASSILDDNSRKLREQATSSLADILNPLHSRIEEFKKAISDTYNAEARERFSLEKSIKDLMELNVSIGREAKELAEALRGNSKTQGDWGEMILEQLLEKSGLTPERHFLIQTTTDLDGRPLVDDEGHRLRPDVVMLYPDDRCVVIDSKVSLTAYVDMVNADTDQERTEAQRRHLDSIKDHIKELGTKNYQDFIGEKRLDFVVMFIPNEAGYIAAMQIDPNIWQEAFDRRVLIASPTHLISILRMLKQLWKQDDINRNVQDIATESGAMLDKFQRFLKEMENIENALNKASEAYKAAYAHLSTGRGNLIRRAELLVKLGAKSKNPTNFSRYALPEEDAPEREE